MNVFSFVYFFTVKTSNANGDTHCENMLRKCSGVQSGKLNKNCNNYGIIELFPFNKFKCLVVTRRGEWNSKIFSPRAEAKRP